MLLLLLSLFGVISLLSFSSNGVVDILLNGISEFVKLVKFSKLQHYIFLEK